MKYASLLRGTAPEDIKEYLCSHPQWPIRAALQCDQAFPHLKVQPVPIRSPRDYADASLSGGRRHAYALGEAEDGTTLSSYPVHQKCLTLARRALAYKEKVESAVSPSVASQSTQANQYAWESPHSTEQLFIYFQARVENFTKINIDRSARNMHFLAFDRFQFYLPDSVANAGGDWKPELPIFQV